MGRHGYINTCVYTSTGVYKRKTQFNFHINTLAFKKIYEPKKWPLIYFVKCRWKPYYDNLVRFVNVIWARQFVPISRCTLRCLYKCVCELMHSFGILRFFSSKMLCMLKRLCRKKFRLYFVKIRFNTFIKRINISFRCRKLSCRGLLICTSNDPMTNLNDKLPNSALFNKL